MLFLAHHSNSVCLEGFLMLRGAHRLFLLYMSRITMSLVTIPANVINVSILIIYLKANIIIATFRKVSHRAIMYYDAHIKMTSSLVASKYQLIIS